MPFLQMYDNTAGSGATSQIIEKIGSNRDSKLATVLG